LVGCRIAVALPYRDAVGGRYVIDEHLFTTSSHRVVRLKSSLGVQLIWDGNSYLELSVPAAYRRAVCGLCGQRTACDRPIGGYRPSLAVPLLRLQTA